jgi:hypothetical protein
MILPILVGVFNGVSDVGHYIAIHSVDPEISISRFQEAWIALKYRFPIIGAQIIEHSNSSTVEFVVDADRLALLRDTEFTITSVNSPTSLHQAIGALMNGPRRLDKDTLASINIINHKGEPRYNLIFALAHYVVDGTAKLTLIRNYLDILASTDSIKPPMLEERLSMAVTSDSLRTGLDPKLSGRRWKNAIAYVLWTDSLARMTGGHTMVNIQDVRAFITPAVTKKAIIRLLEITSRSIIAACRAKGLTFGCVYRVIAQIAFARVLYRMRKRGEITDEEWDHRLRQPTRTGGPLNLRPFLSPD